MTKSTKTKDAAAPLDKAETPNDRPMTGILTRDNGERTEHGLSPLDPSYLGTPIAQNAGIDQARDARVKAGLEEPEEKSGE